MVQNTPNNVIYPANVASMKRTCTHSTRRISCQKNFGKEMNTMSNSNTKCQQLRELHGRLIEELRILKENLREEEHEGVVNPIETATIIISLQKTLNTIELELQKCPDTN